MGSVKKFTCQETINLWMTFCIASSLEACISDIAALQLYDAFMAGLILSKKHTKRPSSSLSLLPTNQPNFNHEIFSVMDVNFTVYSLQSQRTFLFQDRVVLPNSISEPTDSILRQIYAELFPHDG